MYVYKITNTINQRSYIGITSRDPTVRWKEHVVESNKQVSTNIILYNAFKKYGIDVFDFSVIDDTATTYGELLEQEKLYIVQYATLNPLGYNMTEGGVGGDRLYLYPDDKKKEVYKRIAKKAKQTRDTTPGHKEEAARKAKDWWKKMKSDEVEYAKYTNKISASLIAAWKTKILTDEDIATYSNAQKARWLASTDQVKAAQKKELLRGQQMTWKKWRLTYPDKSVIIVTGLHKFCKENNLPYHIIYGSYRVGKPSKHGWVLEQIE